MMIGVRQRQALVMLVKLLLILLVAVGVQAICGTKSIDMTFNLNATELQNRVQVISFRF